MTAAMIPTTTITAPTAMPISLEHVRSASDDDCSSIQQTQRINLYWYYKTY